MAVFHLNIKITSRGKGKSAVAAAAYRAGTKITNEYDGLTHDYSRKRGVLYTEIMLPDHAPREYFDRAVLWNAVEKTEKAKNSALAREVEVALPVELSKEQNTALVREYVKHNFVDKGMCADICIHDTGEGNPHCHILLSVRPINADGTWGTKQRKEYILDNDGNKIYDPKKKTYKCRSVESTDWNDKGNAEIWRESWAGFVNSYLGKLEHGQRIDHRSYVRQGIEQIPTVHLGTAAHQMEKRGIRTELGDVNRDVAVSNKELKQINARLKKLKAWLYSQPLDDAPTMGDILRNTKSTQQLRTQARKIADLKAFAGVVNFLRENNLSSIEQLADKLDDMVKQRYDLAGEIKKQDRRLATLDTHLQQVGIYGQYKDLYNKYIGFKAKRRTAFWNENAKKLSQFETAHEYLKSHLVGRNSIPTTAWKAEREKLLSERYNLAEQYYSLKDDVKSVESLRRGAERAMGEIAVERTAKQSYELEL